jgi:hypothetical protein
MTELSSGVGWALIVFGASLAALALQRPGPSEVDRKPARAGTTRPEITSPEDRT